MAKHKRSYTKTITRTREEKTHLKGKIFIKYRGKHDERDAENILKETFYKIKVTHTNAIIEEIYKNGQPEEFIKISALYKPLELKLEQPISCQIHNKDESTGHYKLQLIDLIIPDPQIVNVTKHESDSFGTITGDFYCYVKEIKTFNEEVIVEECFGETGEIDHKTENGIVYFRKAYYHTDCSKYWGNWIAERTTINTYQSTGKTEASRGYVRYERRNRYNNKTEWSRWQYKPDVLPANTGCVNIIGKILVFFTIALFVLLFIPKLTFLLPFILIPYLLNAAPFRFWAWLFRIAFILFGVLFSLSIISTLFIQRNKSTEQTAVKPKPVVSKPKYTPIINPESSKQSNQKADTLITHHMAWEDYEGKVFEGTFSVRKSAFEQSHLYKQNLDVSGNSESNYDKIIFSLKENDINKLSGLYSMFDSIRKIDKPDPMHFAEIIVSFVQTIPYTLVLPNDCDAQYYQDEFTVKYLSRPDARCDGFEKYGINTPVEFIAGLNGDCDTRTLLLYTILSHYDYDVALLSSSYYSHSILGVNLPYSGVSFNYNNQKYILWETTVKNIKPGVLPDEISNTDYWRISLKSK